MHNAFKRAAKYLHKKSNFNSQDLKHKEVKPLITETFNVLKNAVNTGITTEVPAAMLQKLQTDVFVFSGMKTYTQLKEASLLLLDENNQIKPYAKFEQDVLKIDNTYNQNYLQAEHQHAIAAAQSAAQYHEYMQDAERYNLQIRTAGDDKVRQSHAELNGITLPANHSFWESNWTPFDWNCRCRIIQVLKNKYAITDDGIAQAAAEKAIPEMFRYNPAKQQTVFPEKHPYYLVSKSAMTEVKDILKNEIKSSDTIDLNRYIKDVVSDRHVKNIFAEYANRFPEDFSNGLKDVKFSNSKGYMMQHSIKVNSRTLTRVGQSTISVSTHTFGNGFNPAQELKNGLSAIKEGKTLTFNQEYAFESLWHEILHAKTVSKHPRLSGRQVQHMETVNQFVARHTYPKLIETFGGKAANQKEILDNGYGYKTWLKDFRNELAKKGIDEKKAVEFLEPHLMKDYSSLGQKIDELFGN